MTSHAPTSVTIPRFVYGGNDTSVSSDARIAARNSSGAMSDRSGRVTVGVRGPGTSYAERLDGARSSATRGEVEPAGANDHAYLYLVVTLVTLAVILLV